MPAAEGNVGHREAGRLARNVHFISGLMESGVEFLAVDMPSANRFVVHILAAVAEQEAEAISKRTKAALAAAKERGTVWVAGVFPRSDSRKSARRHGRLSALRRRRQGLRCCRS